MSNLGIERPQPLAGPCLATHTACSSSLVAAHLAANGLANWECGAAVAAGVFMVLLSGTMAGISQLQVCTLAAGLEQAYNKRTAQDGITEAAAATNSMAHSDSEPRTLNTERLPQIALLDYEHGL